MSVEFPNSGVGNLTGRGECPHIPTNSLGSFYNGLKPTGDSSGFSIKHGRVVDIWTKQGVVLVQCAGCNMIKCSMNITSSGIVTGSTEVSIPTIGDLVLVAKLVGADIGTIICAFPSFNNSSMGGVKTVDILENKSIELMDAKTFLMDKTIFSGNQFGPKFKDALPGEKYNLNENLIGYIITKYFMRLQAGDLCSLTFQYLDGLLEAMLHNLRIFNSGFFLESICDFGRTNTELHLSAHLNDFAVETEEERRKNSIIRLFSGWLSAGAHLYSQNKNGEKEPGSDVWIDELGTVSLRSNTTSFMHKVDGIYVPLRKFRADHPNKDEADAEIDDNEPRKAFDWAVGADHPMAFGCQIRDYVAWLVGGQYQFNRYKPYKKDWDKLEDKGGANPVSIDGFWGAYGNDVVLESDGERKGDYNTAKKGEAFCGVLPDGSVLLRDAWGSQVELRGGRVVISGANDVEVTSGSNVVITAGKDAIIKGAENCEVIAINKDMRIRSGKMMLIESVDAGVQITAPKPSGVNTDGKGEEYGVSGIMLKADEVEIVGKKFEANMSNTFYVQGQDHDSPPLFMVRSKSNLFWDTGVTVFKNGDGENYVGIINGNVMSTDGMYADGWGIFYEGMASNGLSVAIDGPIATNGYFVGIPPGGPSDPPMEYMPEMDLASEFDPTYDREQWDVNFRSPYHKEDYEKIKYKHRTTDQYRTESAKWFEKFWQREFKSSLSPIQYAKDKDDDGENSYPGKKHIDGSKKDLILYAEVNVQEDGSPKLPEEQKQEGGTFTSVPYSQQLFKSYI